MTKRIPVLGLAFMLVAIFVAGGTAYRRDATSPTANSFARNDMLSALWSHYKAQFLEASSSRVLDKEQNNLTTSEGQSYALLRAVWQDDQATFDRVLAFTQTALRRPQDHLFSWKFGQRPDHTYGVLTDQGGQNTASDADSDIAFSLVMAYGRWQQSSYLKLAKPIISDIWLEEVVLVAGKPLLTTDALEKNAQQVVTNPSYFAPYAYRAFAVVDKPHDWNGLTDNSYAVISRAVASPLDRSRSAGLPPNWLLLDRQTGAVLAPRGSLNSTFGYDAIRLPWRLALEVNWTGDSRASALLKQMGFLAQQWDSKHIVAATYDHDGSNAAGYESAAAYGATLGAFMTLNPTSARSIYDNKLVSLYNPDTQDWRQTLNYYAANWAWFGIALYQHALPDLTTKIVAS